MKLNIQHAHKSRIAVWLVPAVLLTLLGAVPLGAFLPMPASSASAATNPNLLPGMYIPGVGQACGAGTFGVFGVCVPCFYSPTSCAPKAPVTPTPKVTNERKTNVNTLNKEEAKKNGFQVYDKSTETHAACTVDGAPAYTKPGQPISGKCTRDAERLLDKTAECPAGMHRRTKGSSGEYWCDSNSQEVSINDRFNGRVACLRGVLIFTDAGQCLYCPASKSNGRVLNRAASISSQSCVYSRTQTTAAPVATAAPRVSLAPSSSTTSSTSQPPPIWPPATPLPVSTPPVVPPTSVPDDNLPTEPPEVPVVQLGWSPKVAVTQLPMYLWLEDERGNLLRNPPTARWRNSQGNVVETTIELQRSVWRFEVVDGEGNKSTKSKTCNGAGAKWRKAWIDSDGQPTATARLEGACWYTYQHMGDGEPRELKVTVHWILRTCVPSAVGRQCMNTNRSAVIETQLSVTEIQSVAGTRA